MALAEIMSELQRLSMYRSGSAERAVQLARSFLCSITGSEQPKRGELERIELNEERRRLAAMVREKMSDVGKGQLCRNQLAHMREITALQAELNLLLNCEVLWPEHEFICSDTLDRPISWNRRKVEIMGIAAARTRILLIVRGARDRIHRTIDGILVNFRLPSRGVTVGGQAPRHGWTKPSPAVKAQYEERFGDGSDEAASHWFGRQWDYAHAADCCEREAPLPQEHSLTFVAHGEHDDLPIFFADDEPGQHLCLGASPLSVDVVRGIQLRKERFAREIMKFIQPE